MLTAAEIDAARAPTALLPDGEHGNFTVWREIVLAPGEQHTIPPDTLHWFQAGDEGAVVTEFATTNRDDLDVFTDPKIRRATVVAPG